MPAEIRHRVRTTVKYASLMAAALMLALPCVASAEPVIQTVAGSGASGFSGDGGQAIAALLNQPADIVLDASGNLFIADSSNYRIRKVDASGSIATVAGSGFPLATGDGGPADRAGLMPFGLALDAGGNLYCADLFNNRIRKIDTSGTITTVAGNGQYGYGGDGGPATDAQLYYPVAVAVGVGGSIYIADSYNNRIRKVDASGVISTVAGTGESGDSGDGGSATEAQLRTPSGILVDAGGNLYIADTYNCRIRRVDASGIITTVAGNGAMGFSGDGGAATEAQLWNPVGLALDAADNLFIADSSNNRIRRVDTGGIITTVAGSGTSGYDGDWGPATAAMLHGPKGLAMQAGDLYAADTDNHVVRKVTLAGLALPDFSAAPVLGPSPLEVQFKATVAAAGFAWDFGDNATGTGAAVSHTYQSAGDYDVSLTITGTGGATLTKTKVGYVRVVDTAPVATFTASTVEGAAPLAVTFTDKSTGNINSRQWEFGDGQTDIRAFVRHTYAAAGTYTATLRVTGDDGTSTAARTITVKPGLRTYSISGRVTGDLQQGIDVILSSADFVMTIRTGADGGYGFAGVPNGSYRLTPVRAGYSFDPPYAEAQIAGEAVTGLDFRATAAGPALSQPAASPELAPADGAAEVVFTVSISHPSGLGAISAVTADLAPIGGASSAAMRDDGTQGDAAAGDGAYTLLATVAVDTEPGLKPIAITGEDSDGVSRTAYAGLNVYKTYAGSLGKDQSKQYQIKTENVAGQTLQFVLTQTLGGGSSARVESVRQTVDCAPNMVVISPSGVQSSSQANFSSQTTVEVPEAEAGTWKCTVSSTCDTTVGYELESSISGSGLVSGLVVDAATGTGLDGVSMNTTAGIGRDSEQGVFVMVHPAGSYSLSAGMAGYLTARKTLTVSAGGSAELNIALSEGSDSDGCFLQSALGEGAKLDRLRGFRDRVLAKTAAGRLVIRLYESLSPAAADLMSKHPMLKETVRSLVDRLLPFVKE